jgi:NMD protein affecting ribosome stability and mRNA decay
MADKEKVKNGVWGYKDKCIRCGKDLEHYGFPICDDCFEEDKKLMEMSNTK